MVVYSGEGAARYLDNTNARKRIHQVDNATWTSTMPDESEHYYFEDNDTAKESKVNYFTSIHFGYLPLRCGSSFIIESYIPHRFSSQFGFYQICPGILENDFCNASLENVLENLCVI